MPGQSALGSKRYAVKCAPVRGTEPDDTVWERLRFPDHSKCGRFYLPSGGEPALPRRVLLEFGHPVRLLELRIQLPKVAGEVIDLLLENVHIDGPDEFNFIAGITVAPNIGRL